MFDSPLQAVRDDRAVSDVLAFTIVFSIIITSVALTYTIGFGAIQDAQEGEQSQNAERAMSALGTNFEAVERGEAEGRAGQIALRGGALDVPDDATMNVTVVNSSGATTSGDVAIGSLTYTQEDTELAYQGGGVFRSDDGNSIVVQRPQVRCRDDRAMITIVRIISDESGVSGSTSVEITADAAAGTPSLVYPNATRSASAQQVTLNLSDTRHGEAWERYLTEEDNEWEADGGGDFTCRLGGDGGQVIVRQVTIRISVV